MANMRIHARVTIDESYSALLRDLVNYKGRKRAKRIVFLSALGLVIEKSGIGSATLNPRSVESVHSEHMGANEASAAEDLEFLKKLTASLE